MTLCKLDFFPLYFFLFIFSKFCFESNKNREFRMNTKSFPEDIMGISCLLTNEKTKEKLLPRNDEQDSEIDYY